jgi:hypothetical protein
MAYQKLSPTLFSAKSLAPQPDCSKPPYLHFFSNVPQRQNQYAVVCESRPPMTFSEPRSSRPLPRLRYPKSLKGGCEC